MAGKDAMTDGSDDPGTEERDIYATPHEHGAADDRLAGEAARPPLTLVTESRATRSGSGPAGPRNASERQADSAGGWTYEHGLARMVAQQWELPFLADEDAALDAAAPLGVEDARRLEAVAIDSAGAATTVALVQPSEGLLEELRASLGSETSFAVVARGTLERLLEELQPHPSGPAAEAEREPAPEEPPAGDEATPDVKPTAPPVEAATSVLPADDSSEEFVAELDAAAAGLVALRDRVGELSRSHAAVERELADARTELDGTRGELADARAQVAQAHGELGDVRGELAGVRGELADVRTELAGVRTELAGVRKELARERTARQAAEQRLVDERDRLAGARARLVEVLRTLDGDALNPHAD